MSDKSLPITRIGLVWLDIRNPGSPVLRVRTRSGWQTVAGGYSETLYIDDIQGLTSTLSDINFSLNSKLEDAPLDGNSYTRKNGIWSKITFSGITEETDPTVPQWAKEPNKPTYSYSEILNTPTLFSGSYNDLNNKPSIPTKTSDLTNDSSFITSESDPTVPSYVKNITEQNITDWGNKLSDAPSDNKPYGRKDGSWVEIVTEGGGIITETDPTVPAWAKTENKPTYSYSEISNTPSLATVATSGSYNDLSNTPSIPSSKSDIGLGNVDNTADADKPVSTAQGLAIGAKYTKPELGIPKTDLEASVQTSLGKADSALQSFTETDPTVPSWAKAETKPSYTASEVGLGNVDNTSDANKPISTATQTALNNKQDTLTQGAGISIINNVISSVGGGVADSVDWSNVQNKPVVIGAGATQADARSAIGAGTSNFSGSYNDLTNTPTIPSITGLATETYVDNKVDALTLGDVNVQSDWNVSDNTSDAYIKNKPSIPSISGLATETYVDNKVKTDVPANAKFTDTIYTHPTSHPYSMITGAPASLPANGGDSATVNGKTVEENVPAGAKFTDTLTTINSKTGVITKADIVALGIPAQDTVYTHPTGTNPHGTTKSDVGLGNVDNVKQIPYSEKGANNGVAELDSGGKVPSSQLPSYVDDVLEYANSSSFPATGESGKIYIAINTNITYRWTGSGYVEISQSIALGETSATAYRGDRGKTAYDHSQTAHAPTNAQKNSDITKAEIEAKLTGAITSHTHSYLSDSPQDGKIYGRKDSSWTEISSGSGADVYDWTWLQQIYPPSGTCTQQQYDELLAAAWAGKIFSQGASVSGFPVENDEIAVSVNVLQSTPTSVFIVSWIVFPDLNVIINGTDIPIQQVVAELPAYPKTGVFYFVKE